MERSLGECVIVWYERHHTKREEGPPEDNENYWEDHRNKAFPSLDTVHSPLRGTDCRPFSETHIALDTLCLSGEAPDTAEIPLATQHRDKTSNCCTREHIFGPIYSNNWMFITQRCNDYWVMTPLDQLVGTKSPRKTKAWFKGWRNPVRTAWKNTFTLVFEFIFSPPFYLLLFHFGTSCCQTLSECFMGAEHIWLPSDWHRRPAINHKHNASLNQIVCRSGLIFYICWYAELS